MIGHTVTPRKPAVVPLLLILIAAAPATRAAQYMAAAGLADLSLEELANLEITSVSRQRETLSEAAAAAYIITREDIVRSGVTSLAEALRLAPGVEVARSGANSWDVSLRGFNSNLSNKLLVLIDGRSVYSPLYAGVFWDAQDVLIEDIDRIEVIAGPGGTLWGANAVNGVINVITRSAAATTGGYLTAGGGNEERVFGGARYGWEAGDGLHARVYTKFYARDDSATATGGDTVDASKFLRGGFRMDWTAPRGDQVTFQGDAYAGETDGKFPAPFTIGTLPGPDVVDDAEISGANLLGLWRRDLDSGTNFELQAYYDYVLRAYQGLYTEKRQTMDLQFQNQLQPARGHDLIWGAGARLTGDELDNSIRAMFLPESRTDLTLSLFVQDKIAVMTDTLFLTLGSKFEHNEYTGFEIQPNVRLTWLPGERQTLWAAVSRAVRIPARLDTDLSFIAPVDAGGGLPLYINVEGNQDLDSESLIAYEAGYRIQAGSDLTFDLAAFYNDYEKIVSTEANPVPDVVTDPVTYLNLFASFGNGIEAESYGSTVMARWQPLDSWRLQAQYTYFDIHARAAPASLDGGTPQDIEGIAPQHQAALYSFLELPYGLDFYTGVRFVDDIPSAGLDDYIALDANLRWLPREDFELSLTGRNLTDRYHLENSDGRRIERSIYARLSWRF